MSCNVLRQFVGAGRGGGGVGAVDIREWGGGGVVQNRESPDFRSPEVGRYAGACTSTSYYGLSWIFKRKRDYSQSKQKLPGTVCCQSCFPINFDQESYLVLW